MEDEGMGMNEDGSVTVMRGLTDAEKRAADLGKRIADEAEAWKVAQLAATLRNAQIQLEGPDFLTIRQDVEQARWILAEARRQVEAEPEVQYPFAESRREAAAPAGEVQ